MTAFIEPSWITFDLKYLLKHVLGDIQDPVYLIFYSKGYVGPSKKPQVS